MIAKYINHFSILSMFTPIDYNIIGNTNGLLLNYYWIVVQNVFCVFFLHSGRRPTGAKRPSAGCPECICNRPRPWRRPCVSDWGCGAVILLSRGEFGREKNKICYQRVCVWTFYYMPNLWYNIVILQHIFILRNNRCERSYFVFNLGSFARNRECETQVCLFGVFFFKSTLSINACFYADTRISL